MGNNTLKLLRSKQGLQQKEFAKMMGMKQSTYASKENGARRFTLSEAIKISEFFNCEPKDIFLNK